MNIACLESEEKQFMLLVHDGKFFAPNIVSAKYGRLHLSDSIELRHFLRIRRIEFYSLAKRIFSREA